jgi:hypothetical protein
MATSIVLACWLKALLGPASGHKLTLKPDIHFGSSDDGTGVGTANVANMATVTHVFCLS